MNPQRMVMVALGVALAAAGVGALLSGDEELPGDVDAGTEKPGRVMLGLGVADSLDEAPLVSLESVSIEQLSLSKLGVLPDGGAGAYVTEEDGGIVVLEEFPCVRRRKDSAPDSCMRQVPGFEVADFGELNRFPRSLAVGADCEPVPCSVWAGDEP